MERTPLIVVFKQIQDSFSSLPPPSTDVSSGGMSGKWMVRRGYNATSPSQSCHLLHQVYRPHFKGTKDSELYEGSRRTSRRRRRKTKQNGILITNRPGKRQKLLLCCRRRRAAAAVAMTGEISPRSRRANTKVRRKKHTPVELKQQGYFLKHQH